jgi:hypothetical protein
MHDLTRGRVQPAFVKKPERDPRAPAERGERILETILETLDETVARHGGYTGARAGSTT